MQQNNISKRLTFIKSELSLTYAKISDDTNIPKSTLKDFFDGRRTTFYEMVEYLAFYFNLKWQKENMSPLFEGSNIDEITFKWILLGYDDNKEKRDKEIRELKDYFYMENLK